MRKPFSYLSSSLRFKQWKRFDAAMLIFHVGIGQMVVCKVTDTNTMKSV